MHIKKLGGIQLLSTELLLVITITTVILGIFITLETNIYEKLTAHGNEFQLKTADQMCSWISDSISINQGEVEIENCATITKSLSTHQTEFGKIKIKGNHYG